RLGRVARLEAAGGAGRGRRGATPRRRRERKATLGALERCGIAADARELQHPSRLARAGPEQLEDRAREGVSFAEGQEPVGIGRNSERRGRCDDERWPGRRGDREGAPELGERTERDREPREVVTSTPKR